MSPPAGVRDGLLRAEAHRVVLAEDRVDVGLAAPACPPSAEAAVGAPLAPAGRDERLDVGALELRLDAVAARRADGVVGRAAADDDDLALAAEPLDDKGADALADGAVVGADPAGELAALEQAVDHDHRHARPAGSPRAPPAPPRSRRRRRSAPLTPWFSRSSTSVGQLRDVAAGVGGEHADVGEVGGLVLHRRVHADEVGAAERQVHHADLDAPPAPPPAPAPSASAAAPESARSLNRSSCFFLPWFPVMPSSAGPAPPPG